MSCPNCAHTLAKLNDVDPIYFACIRCGTLVKVVGTHTDTYTPKLVDRCRAFRENARTTFSNDPSLTEQWVSAGMEESIYLPRDRVTS